MTEKTLGWYINQALIGLVRIYQWFVSPLLGPCCRFYPTCSEYTIQAIRKYGSLKGLWWGIKRISRCHPWSAGGYDPLR
ncbi:MAG TPA: membrane protein insertion efficiency factor YidD [Syntrophales bacterium]|nr:membrane protein insertion efficiency factor YidD [Syntrophales bacterium]HOL58280.1 membrane protein insertion efficiency factor YidD [Syntrophales bacterium]HPO34449.1 membrane protein insertion efficiency factor YidD [Syntrophales bacterium]